jgi:hypothetical protein
MNEWSSLDRRLDGPRQQSGPCEPIVPVVHQTRPPYSPWTIRVAGTRVSTTASRRPDQHWDPPSLLPET